MDPDGPTSLIEQLPAGVIRIDASGRIRGLNPAATDLLGRVRDAVLDAPLHETVHAAQLDGTPLESYYCPLCGSIEAGRSVHGWEGLLHRADGQPLRVIASASPYFNESGQRSGGLIVFQPPTEQPGIDERLHQREAELAASERRLREMAEAIDQVFWSRNADNQIDFINSAYERVWGRSRASLYEDPGSFLEAIHPEDYERVKETLHAVWSQPGRARTLQYRIIRPDGAVRWIEDRQYALPTQDERKARAVGTALDITEHMETRRGLEEANQAKTEFLNAVNHDLRTPLNAIIGFTELLSKSELDEIQQRYLALCRSGAHRMLELVETLSDLARLNTGGACLRPRPTPLHSFLDEHREHLAVQAAEKGIAFHWQVDETLPERACIDATRFSQVLLNLTQNAIKFTDEGSVQVKLRREGGHQFRLTVVDTGPGIDRADQARIFQPFERGGTPSTRRPGSGLGLSICQRLVRLMGGELTVTSKAGQGSAFHATVELPPASEPSCSCEPTEADDPAETTMAASGLEILIAEDEPVNALLMQTLLERAGARVTVVEDGQWAIATWQHLCPDLMFMDASMPRLDGIQALEAIRRIEQEEGRQRTPIVLVTAHDAETDHPRIQQADADTRVQKPLSERPLMQILQSLASG